MKLVCPSCGLTASAEAWINDAAARDLLLAVAGMPAPLPKVVLPYLAIFRPEKQALRWDKAGKIVAELAKMIASGHIQVQGRGARPCPPRIWGQAMEQMVERRDSIRRPLPNHNYLKQVAWQLADEEDGRNEATRRQMEASGAIGRERASNTGDRLIFAEKTAKKNLSPQAVSDLSPIDAYIQGHREDKPSQEEVQEWFAGRLR